MAEGGPQLAADAKVRAFLEVNRSAAMVTLRRDGTPHAARVALAVIDGRLWSSGTQTRLRTRHLRSDPRCTLFVFGSGAGFLGLETTVTILEGPDVPLQTLRLFQKLQPDAKPGTITWFGQERPNAEFLELMVTERRILYEFDIQRAYGIY